MCQLIAILLYMNYAHTHGKRVANERFGQFLVNKKGYEMIHITENDKNLMELLNDMQTLATKVSFTNKHKRLNTWINDLKESLNTVVEFHNKEILQRIDANAPITKEKG